MSDETASPRRRVRRRRIAPSSSGRDVVTASLPALACFLGGATEKWAEGLVLIVLGLLLLVSPPRFSLGWMVNAIMVALLAAAALAFLPAQWFYQPPWRVALANDFEINLPASLTPQPWITASCLSSLFAGICWFYYVGTQRLEGRSVRRQFRVFAGAIVLLATLCVILYWRGTTLPFWHSPRGFGPFPNRNQTANLFGLAALIVLACGHDDLRLKKKRWIVWFIGLAFLVTAIVLNFSRAGILLLVAGFGIWFAVLILRSRSAGTIAIGFSALLALLTVILLFGGATLERFNLRAPEGMELSTEFRWLIFKDAFRLLHDTPWAGLGLGNFDSVFAIFRDASLVQRRAIHPDSDWIWLWAEMGPAAVVLILLAAILLARRVFPLSEGTAQRIRLAALVAGALFALHGIVDVGGHRIGTAFAGLFLFGLALRRPEEGQANAWLPYLFRASGLVVLGAGLLWVVASYRQTSVPGSVGADNERRLAKAANVGRQHRETIARANRGLEWAPLDWQLYFLRALGRLGAQRPPPAILADFRRARFLEPNSFEVPYQEGLAWLVAQPGLSVAAWSEALRRARPERDELFGRMLTRAEISNKTVKQELVKMSADEPDLALVLLERARGNDFAEALHLLLQSDNNLERMNAEQRSKLFVYWSDHGDTVQLAAYLETHPHLLDFGWRGMAKRKVAGGDFRGAVELAQRFGPRPAMPTVAEETPAEQLQRALLANPNDYLAALALFQRQMREGKTNDALITVRRLTEKPSVPPYFHFLEAEAWAASGDWERAWKAWQAYEGGAAK